jgi:hypothetical protein
MLFGQETLTKTLLQQNQLNIEQRRRDLILLKRKALTITLILALLSPALAGIQLRLLVKANFVFPPINPRIDIISPTNTTYNTNNLTLQVTTATFKTAYPGGPTSDDTRLFTYSLDGKNPENITITNASVAVNPGATSFLRVQCVYLN